MNNHENIIAGNSDSPLIRYSAASMMEFSWKYEHYGGGILNNNYYDSGNANDIDDDDNDDDQTRVLPRGLPIAHWQ